METSEGETGKGPEFFLESQKKLRLQEYCLCVVVSLHGAAPASHFFPPTSQPSGRSPTSVHLYTESTVD